MSYLTIDADTGLRRSAIRWPDGRWRPVDGCRWCGHGPGAHALCWFPANPGHHWQPPTVAQVRARRAANARATSSRVEVVPVPRHAAPAGYQLPPGVDTGVLMRIRDGLVNL